MRASGPAPGGGACLRGVADKARATAPMRRRGDRAGGDACTHGRLGRCSPAPVVEMAAPCWCCWPSLPAHSSGGRSCVRASPAGMATPPAQTLAPTAGRPASLACVAAILASIAVANAYLTPGSLKQA